MSRPSIMLPDFDPAGKFVVNRSFSWNGVAMLPAMPGKPATPFDPSAVPRRRLQALYDTRKITYAPGFEPKSRRESRVSAGEVSPQAPMQIVHDVATGVILTPTAHDPSSPFARDPREVAREEAEQAAQEAAPAAPRRAGAAPAATDAPEGAHPPTSRAPAPAKTGVMTIAPGRKPGMWRVHMDGQKISADMPRDKCEEFVENRRHAASLAA